MIDAAVERAADALAERYSTWTWSRERWVELAEFVLDAARPSRVRHERRVHLRRPGPEDDVRIGPQPACSLALRSRQFEVTTDPELVTCGHCRRILREMAA